MKDFHKGSGGINEGIKAAGLVTYTLRGPDGKIKERQQKNTVVNLGKYHLAALLCGTPIGAGSTGSGTPALMQYIGIGTGTQGVLPTDTTLTPEGVGSNEISRKLVTVRSQGENTAANVVTFVAEWGPTEGNGTITEAGLFNQPGFNPAPSGGEMFARVLFQNPKGKESGDTLTITWLVTILL